jgi:VIT1/CCC1 family predicted Fe2+/Mn2+ transporter
MGISKRLDEARKAYRNGDQQASAQAHDPARIAKLTSEPHGGTGSQYIGEMVYGGLDGIITTFAVVSGVAGAQLGANVVLILGMANLLADGFSMATGAYLSAKSEREYYDREQARERWEVEHFPEGERAELYELYIQRGYTDEDARNLVEVQTRTVDRWVGAMMIDELGMHRDERNPLLNALATLGSFIVAGSVPLLVYLLGLIVPITPQASFIVSFVLSGLALFCLGAAKVFITERNPIKGGLEMLLVGGLAAVVAYLVGALLKGIGS